MTKDKMTNVEKARLEGMEAILNIDICGHFDCPAEGCSECPLAKVVDLHTDLVDAIDRLINK